jgi:arylsulfatase A-like enzyme
MLMLVTLGARCSPDGQQVQQRPNIVVVVTDDQGFGDLGRAGEIDCDDPLADPASCQHPLETALQAAGLESFTPNLDRLSHEGVAFRDFHVTPLCAPTRAALMTGRFNQRTGVLNPISDRQILAPDETTLAELFRRAGYRTGMFGKWNLGEHAPARPQDRGFDEVLQMRSASPGFTGDYWGNDCFGDTYFDEDDEGVAFGPNHAPPQPGDPYCTDVIFDAARGFIAEQVNQAPGQPFLAYIATIAPHDLRTAPPRGFAPPNDPDPSVVYESLGVHPVLADFYGAIHGIDEQIGELRDFLQGMGLEDNTILVVLNDNGSQLTVSPPLPAAATLAVDYGLDVLDPSYDSFINPAGLRDYKGGIYEGGHRAFLYMRWPDGGITGETLQQIDALTHVSDLLPTLVDLAGIGIEPAVRERLDGISWQSLLSGNPDDAFNQRTVLVQQDLGVEDPLTGAMTPRPFFNFAVVTPDWRLVHPGSGASELYGTADRAQITDVAAANPDVVAELETRWSAYYDSWVERYDDPQDRGRISIGGARATRQTLATSSWVAPIGGSFVPVTFQDGISTRERATPVRGFWALEVSRSGFYSIKLRRWPGIDLAPASVADRPIDPRGNGSARLFISPEYADLDSLSLSGSGANFVDLEKPIGASDTEAEFIVLLEAGLAFLGGELTGVREFAVGCDVDTAPAACPEVHRSPYYAVVSAIPHCSDGIDDDGDGLIDYPDDPGCRDPQWLYENPKCDDGLDNDDDGNIDWDGGPGGGTPDAQCTTAWRNRECGLGFELVLLAPLLARLRRARSAR